MSFYGETEPWMVAKPQLGELYARTIQTYNREPKDGEFDAWLNVLGGFTFGDVDSALRRWQADTTLEDYTNRPKGARMPSPAEVLASIQKFENANQTRFISCGKCEEGWVRVFDGHTDGWRPGMSNPEAHKVDPKIGAVKRCECFINWARRRKAQ
jgi:hypothetical protein